MQVLHIALGTHNQELDKAIDSIGECRRIVWNKPKNPDLELRNLLRAFKPDITFMQLQRQTMIRDKTIASIGGIVFNWTGDVRDPIPNFFRTCPAIPLFSNQTDVDTFHKEGREAYFLNVGFADERIQPDGPSVDGGDIVFMGSNYGQFPLSKFRLDMCLELSRTYGDKFGLYGSNWFKPTPNLGNDYSKINPIYRGCKIAINLSHFNYDRYTSDRMFRIMGAGAFCLSHHYKGIEKDFEVGVHLDTWRTIDELKEKINYYLINPEQRNKIAAEGCKLVHKKHTWQSRKQELMSIYEDCVQKRKK